MVHTSVHAPKLPKTHQNRTDSRVSQRSKIIEQAVGKPDSTASKMPARMDAKEEKQLRKLLTRTTAAFVKKRTKALKRGTTLFNPAFSLAGKGFGPGSAAVLLEFEDLVAWTISLNLSKNDLGGSGIAIVAGALVRWRAQTLDLRNNDIDDDGARALAAALPRSVVETLLLQGNSISDAGVDALARAVPSAPQLKKLVVTGNGKHRAKTKKALKKALKAPKVLRSINTHIASTKVGQSQPPPGPGDGDVRLIEEQTLAVVDDFVKSYGCCGCGGGTKIKNPKALAQLEALSNYSDAIPLLRDSTEALELLKPLAYGESKPKSESDQVRAAMALASIIGETSDGAAQLRAGGVLETLFAQLNSTTKATPEAFAGVKWDLGHLLVPLMALSAQPENRESLGGAADDILKAASKLFASERPTDVERAVNVLAHLNVAGNGPSSAADEQKMLRDVQYKAAASSRGGERDFSDPYYQAGFEAAAMLDLMDAAKHGDLLPPAKAASGPGSTDVMISYQWDAQETAKRLKQALEERGLTVAIDLHFMSGSIYSAMSHAIASTQSVVLLASYKYRLSANCQREASFAADMRKCIVPCIVQTGYRPEDWLGLVVAGSLYFDLTMSGEDAFNAEVDRVVREVRAAAA